MSPEREPRLHSVTVTVNGTQYTREVEPRQLLVYFIREQIGLTGTHVGCDTSQCGACTILVNGLAMSPCTPEGERCTRPSSSMPLQPAWKRRSVCCRTRRQSSSRAGIACCRS